MIHYSLVCDKSHKFDGWFSNAAAYDAQKLRGLVTCPICLTTAVDKAIMAPAVNRTDGTEKVSLSIGHPQHPHGSGGVSDEQVTGSVPIRLV